MSTIDTTPKMVRILLKLLRVRVTTKTIVSTLQKHPNYPNLSAISYALQEWQVDNLAVQVDPEQLINVPTPYIVHREDEGGFFIVIRSFKNGIVEWIHPNNGWQHEPFHDFKKHWIGLVLIAEPNSKSGESNYLSNFLQEISQILRLPALIIGALLLAGLAMRTQPFGSIFWAWSSIKLIGAVICCLLITISVDQSNTLAQKLCGVGEKANCSSVLASPVASILGLISWSEIGFIYFVGSWLSLVYAAKIHDIHIQNSISDLLLWCDFLALPFTFLSIWYQNYVLKQWCILCLIVLSLLWTESVIGQLFGLKLTAVNWSAIWMLSVCLLIPILTLIFVKPYLVNIQKIQLVNTDLQIFRSNPAVFQTLLHQQIKKRGEPPKEILITLGVFNAPHTLTIITNLFCHPCLRLHNELTDLLEGTEAVNAQLILMVPQQLDNPRRAVLSRFLRLSYEERLTALRVWAANPQQDLEQCLNSFTPHYELALANSWLVLSEEWCKLNNIEATPTVFFDEYQIPNGYRLQDVVELCKYGNSNPSQKAVQESC